MGAGGIAATVSGVGRTVRRMIIDCDGCTGRPSACSDCVVTFVLEVPERRRPGRRPSRERDERACPTDGPTTARGGGVGGPLGPFELDDDERRALDALADVHLVPPLRMVRGG